MAPTAAARTLRLTWPGEQVVKVCSSAGMLSSKC